MEGDILTTIRVFLVIFSEYYSHLLKAQRLVIEFNENNNLDKRKRNRQECLDIIDLNVLLLWVKNTKRALRDNARKLPKN